MEALQMYTAQYKMNNSYAAWTVLGSYGSEAEAVNSAQRRKAAGAAMVRVVNRAGAVVYSG
jgi:hypothetical protein